MEDMTTDSEIGEIWSPSVAPVRTPPRSAENGAPRPTAAGIAKGSTRAMVPQDDPVANAIIPAMIKTAVGSIHAGKFAATKAPTTKFAVPSSLQKEETLNA